MKDCREPEILCGARKVSNEHLPGIQAMLPEIWIDLTWREELGFSVGLKIRLPTGGFPAPQKGCLALGHFVASRFNRAIEVVASLRLH